MRTFVTGASGFIGFKLYERLARRGAPVAGWIPTESESSPLKLERIAALTALVEKHPNARLYSGSHLGEAADSMRDFAPTACVHLAGRSSVRESLNDPGLYAESNGAGTIAVLEAARAAGCRRVLHASTVMIYGKDAPLPYNEQRIGGTPASFYGSSKLAAETLMNTWRALYEMETINLRLFSVYGPNLRPDCVPHLVASAILEGREFNVFGDGSSVRDYIQIEDVLEAIDAAIRVSWNKNCPNAINIGSGIGTSLIEMVGQLEQGLSKKAQLVYKSAVSSELQAVVGDIATAHQFLGWKPRVILHDGIAQLCAWFRTAGFQPASFTKQ